MTNEIELLPCPYCGGSAELDYSVLKINRNNCWRFKCKKCGASASMSFTSKDEAIKNWNTRCNTYIADIKLLREALHYMYFAWLNADPDFRYDKPIKALAATDKPEYR